MNARFAELTGPQTASVLTADTVLVLPLGAIEHHGPHLPLCTDLTIAECVAADVAATHDDVWLLPSLAATKSDEHAWASGTLSLAWDTLMLVLLDLGRSIAATPARRLLMLNGHGGNSALLQVAAREIRKESGLHTFVMHPTVPVDQAGGGEGVDTELGMGVHGGRVETSLMLHLRPDLVQMERAERSVPDHLTQYEHVGFGRFVGFGWLSDDFGTGGVIGDPTGSTAEQGREMYGRIVDRCAAALAEVARFTPGA